MKMYNVLENLCNNVAVGTLTSAVNYAKDTLSGVAEIKPLSGLSFVARLKGKSNYTVMVEAHIDEVGFIVTDITDDGFVRVAPCGGIDCRILPAAPVTVWGKEEVSGVFCSTPPHLLKGESECLEITDMYIDTCLGKRANQVIQKGDFVTYRAKFQPLMGDRVTAKSLDDRAACAVLIELCNRLCKSELPCNIDFLFADGEELGCRGSKTAGFALAPDEAVVIDVSFADAPDVPPSKCGKLGSGAMIGISPVLDRKITNTLISIARNKNIPYQEEVMGQRTGTDADSVTLTAQGIPCGLISIPERNMHTPCEIVDIKDIMGVCDILEEYLLKGGALCD